MQNLQILKNANIIKFLLPKIQTNPLLATFSANIGVCNQRAGSGKSPCDLPSAILSASDPRQLLGLPFVLPYELPQKLFQIFRTLFQIWLYPLMKRKQLQSSQHYKKISV